MVQIAHSNQRQLKLDVDSSFTELSIEIEQFMPVRRGITLSKVTTNEIISVITIFNSKQCYSLSISLIVQDVRECS